MLLSLEEGASFWNQKLTWRMLVCSMVALFVLHFFTAGTLTTHDGQQGDWGDLASGGLFALGNFAYFSRKSHNQESNNCKAIPVGATEDLWEEVGDGGF